MNCEYAACARPAVIEADGWAFCRLHLRHHEAIRDDQPLPLEAPIFPAFAFHQPCGTEAASRRHNRRGESCRVCRDADSRRRNPRPASQKKWHGIAS
jgi:hypothetical protein